MKQYKNFEDYIEQSFNQLKTLDIKQNYPEIYEYTQQLIRHFDEIVAQISPNNFWEIYPEILGIDARFVLLNSLLTEECVEFDTEEELIAIIEKDYRTVNKENCGYNLKQEAHHSLIFSVR